MRTFLLIAFLSASCMAGQVSDGTKNGILVFDDAWSQKDFTHRNFSGQANISGKTIYQTSFYQERKTTDVGCGWLTTFPAVITSTVTFVNCNLDNVFLQPTNIVLIDSSHRRIKLINGCDWEVDAQCNAIQLMDPTCGQ